MTILPSGAPSGTCPDLKAGLKRPDSSAFSVGYTPGAFSASGKPSGGSSYVSLIDSTPFIGNAIPDAQAVAAAHAAARLAGACNDGNDDEQQRVQQQQKQPWLGRNLFTSG